MISSRKLVVFGATGGTGEQIIRQALIAGHHVTAVVRRPDAGTEQHTRLDVRTADVLAPASLAGIMTGADAVLSAVGPRDGRQPTQVYSEGTRNVRAEMASAGVRRLLVISADPASAPGEKGLLDRFVVHPLLHRIFGPSYDDLRRMEADLRATTDLDCTIFRPPRLADGPATGSCRTAVGTRLPRARRITRADLAGAMLAGVDDPALIRQTVSIAN